MSLPEDVVFKAATVLGASLIACSLIGAWAVSNVRSQDQTIMITGSAKKRIRSDSAQWNATINRQAPTLVETYKALNADLPVLKAYLLSKGIAAADMTVNAIQTSTVQEKNSLGQETGKILGYQLSESIDVKSKDVNKVERLARESTELIEKGLSLQSASPEFHCSKLGEMKVEMLAEAAKDAKARAEQIAASTGSHIGPLRSARMGSMQITPPDSNQVSDSGINDLSSIEKELTAVVNASFAIQ